MSWMTRDFFWKEPKKEYEIKKCSVGNDNDSLCTHMPLHCNECLEFLCFCSTEARHLRCTCHNTKIDSAHFVMGFFLLIPNSFWGMPLQIAENHFNSKIKQHHQNQNCWWDNRKSVLIGYFRFVSYLVVKILIDLMYLRVSGYGNIHFDFTLNLKCMTVNSVCCILVVENTQPSIHS